MKGFERKNQLFSLCGLNCGLCPMRLGNYCGGCGNGNQSCGIAKCSLEHGKIEYCYECKQYPCEKYQHIDDYDSFITYKRRKADLERAKNLTEEELINMMEKETILTPQQCLDYGFCDEIAETTIDENKLLQSERKILNQMKRDMLSQKSMREEMLAFIKLANNPIQQTTIESSETKEPKRNMMGSFFNAILK